MAHHSDSSVQRDAEHVIREGVAASIGKPLAPATVTFGPDDTALAVDGVAEDESVLLEVFAHVGKMKGSQKHKVALDAFRLVTLKQSRPDARLILAFGDQAAATYALTTGWLAKALQVWGIDVMVVDIPSDLRDRLTATQLDQRDALAGPAEQ